MVTDLEMLACASEFVLTLLSLKTNTDAFVNSADPDEMAHQDLHCLPFCYPFSTVTPICYNGCVQIQRWESPFSNSG